MLSASPKLQGIHPYQSTASSQGQLRILHELQQMLSEIAGLPAALDAEISAILAEPPKEESLQEAIAQIRTTDIASEIERKRVETQRISRPNQAHCLLAAPG